MSEHFLHELLNPTSVAFYGANNSLGTTMGSMQLVNLIISGFDGKIYPVHLKLDNVLGYKAYRSITDVPEIPDLVVIVLPPRVVPEVLRECGQKGIKYAVLISGGFRELSGERDNDLTEDIVKIAEKYGIRFIGPNCFGFYNAWRYPENNGKVFNMMIFQEQKGRGRFSIASQSGTMTSHLFFDPEHLDLGIGKTISVGNEANIDLVDFMEYFREDDETEIIGLYIEEIKRGKRFMELARDVGLKKPIVAIYAGGSKAGNRAISSHTGSMAGDKKIFEAMVKETGIILTDYVEEFLDLAVILSKLEGNYPKGKRLGIITNSGGPGAMIADNAESKGLLVPEFSSELKQKLHKLLPHTASATNPVDITFDSNIFNFYVNFPKLLMKSGEVDFIIMYGAIGFHTLFGKALNYEKISPYLEVRKDMFKFADTLDDLLITPTIKNSKKYGVPFIYVNPQAYNSEWSNKIRNKGGIVFKLWDRPVNCMAKICQYVDFLRTHETK
ncbi:MAG: CoA-binding protein [Candidatus Lokiarchaeota archaeon]|nr:CoA-binding protein [Candidatus Lokiarchaeota archaeon]